MTDNNSFPKLYRNIAIKVRFDSQELEKLDGLRGDVNRSRYIREMSLGEHDLRGKRDKEFLLAFARIGNNLNQIAKRVNIETLENSNNLNYGLLLIELQKIENKLDEIKELFFYVD